MCGLVGVAGNINLPVERAFKRLLELDTTRGPHSTGIYVCKTDGKGSLVKGVGTPWDLAETRGFDDAFRGIARVFLGHNRWATKGKINKHNAHPFEFDRVVGAHNGTLRSVYDLDDYEDFDVDSENIYHHMNNNGVYDTIPKLNGAFALTWYDKADKSINLIRNSERSLFYAFSEDGKTLLWASEDWMLAVASYQSGVKIGEIVDLPEGHLHTFDLPQYSADKFEKVRVRKLELYTPPAYKGNVFPQDKKDKVVELRPKEEQFQKKPSFVEYADYLGEEIVFFTAAKGTTSSGQSYIQCWLVNDDRFSVRVFPQEGSALWEKMMGSSNYFKGVAKSCGSNDGTYLAIDLRTIAEVPVGSEGDDSPELFAAYEGEMINKEEFDKRTHHGCAWCSCHVDVKDAPQIAWVSKNDFVCPDCADQEEVKQYITKH